MRKYWGYIVAPFLFLLGLFFYEKKSKDSLQVELDKSNANNEGAVLAYQQKEQQENIKQQEANLTKLKEEHDKTTQEDTTPAQNEEFWKSRGHSSK